MSGISNDTARSWCLENQVLPDATIDGRLVHVRDIRAFEYGRSKQETRVAYYDRTFSLDDLTSVDFFVEPFSARKGLPSLGKAHTFLSFGFGDHYVAVSVEVRRKEGETYSPTKGLRHTYHLLYVVADERDVVKLRTNHRKSDVHLYPIRPRTVELAQEMFRSMMQRVHELHEKPEFYHTLTNNCTTNLARHLNEINPGRVPASLALLLPGYADRLAYRLGLIRTGRTFAETKHLCKIREVALANGDAPDFSQRIRQHIPLLGWNALV